MAIDIFKAIKAAQPVSSVFQRQKPADKSIVEMMAANAPAAAVYQWPGQKEAYTQPVTRAIPAGAETTTSAILASPAERAYAAEKSRVAQMAAQNPDLQRYEVARQAAVAKDAPAEAVQKAEDIGMQIWAQKYGKTLAPKVQPGQAGYDVIQKTLYPGGTPLPEMSPESIAMLDAIAPADSTGIRPDITPMPGALPVFSDASDDMYQAVMGIRGALPNPTTQNPSPAAASSQQSGISFGDASFETPASQRRSALFAQLLSGISQYGGTP